MMAMVYRIGALVAFLLSWACDHARIEYDVTPISRTITYLIIHTSATKEGHHVDGEDILRWHTATAPKGRGWQTGGYHRLVLLDGTVEKLYPFNQVTNGALGLNDQAIHFCYIGGVDLNRRPKDTRTKDQKKALALLVRDAVERFPNILIAGHGDVQALQGRRRHKACPAFDTTAWLKTIGIDEKHFLIHDKAKGYGKNLVGSGERKTREPIGSFRTFGTPSFFYHYFDLLDFPIDSSP
ncbi:MAG: N-acetylmuramoyl-L-alanine amidase [Flavobacteriaceae bacterium]|nr:N-acetylmuramoyl-L-alanine amidase [Flavobacteriaceae bacterium]